MTQGTFSNGLSSHSVDQLIRHLVASQQIPNQHQLRLIVNHIGAAPFRPDRVRVDLSVRGKTLQGHHFSRSMEASLIAHWGKRILADKEWDVSTTIQQYERDVRTSAVSANAIRFGHTLAQGIQVGTLVENWIPSHRLGALSKPYIYVVYSASHGSIITGYQVTGSTINHGGDLIWLQ